MACRRIVVGPPTEAVVRWEPPPVRATWLPGPLVLLLGASLQSAKQAAAPTPPQLRPPRPRLIREVPFAWHAPALPAVTEKTAPTERSPR